MTDQFAFLGDKCKAAIAAMSLGVLLLLPASFGFGGTIIQQAFGQFNLPLLEEEEAEEAGEENGGLVVEEEETTTTTPTTPTTPPAAAPTNTTNSIEDPSTFLLRGFIGSTLPAQDAADTALTADDDSGHIVTGRFRIFANESRVQRFVAETYVAAIDGSSFHNITIEEGPPHRFEVTEGNGTTTIPAVSSSIVGRIFLNGGSTAIIDNVPMTITIRGSSLAIEGIDIDETRITDTGQRDIISIIDGQSIYGTIPRV